MRNFFGLLAVLAGISHAVTAQPTPDFLKDPETIDRDNPPGMIELQIPSGSAMMNGILYTADGAGPHPTIVMLHGFPGNEKNLDTAQALRRTGFNVLYFHYRGAWGSGGDYSLKNVVADAKAAIAYVREKGAKGDYRIDANRVGLFGHSLGGFNALLNGAADQAIRCTVAAAPADMVNFVESADPNIVVSAGANTPVPGLKDYSFANLIHDTLADKESFNLQAKMTGFKGRPLMIVTAKQDSVVPPAGQQALANAATTAGAKPFRHVVMEGDHGFAWTRIAFNSAVVGWMSRNCM